MRVWPVALLVLTACSSAPDGPPHEQTVLVCQDVADSVSPNTPGSGTVSLDNVRGTVSTLITLGSSRYNEDIPDDLVEALEDAETYARELQPELRLGSSVSASSINSSIRSIYAACENAGVDMPDD